MSKYIFEVYNSNNIIITMDKLSAILWA
jgi:hypothetical protein